MAKGVDINAVFNQVTGQGTQNPRYGIVGKLIGANMNSTADQTIPLNTGIAKYQPDVIQCVNASISLTTAAGGIYTAASKGGTAVVAAVQAYSTLTAATKVLPLTIASTDTRTAALILSLTTPQGAGATADFYIWGYIYS